MAYIKIHPIKVTDNKALEYITNPDKTDEKLLVSSFACSPESASIEFAMTREAGKNNVMDKGNNLAFHLIQSFKPGEVDAETAHRLIPLLKSICTMLLLLFRTLKAKTFFYCFSKIPIFEEFFRY